MRVKNIYIHVRTGRVSLETSNVHMGIIFAQRWKSFIFSPTHKWNGLTAIYFRADMLIWTLRPTITFGKSGFFPDSFLGGPPAHPPSLIPALFISSLMTVWPLLLAKGVTNPSGHWHRFEPQLQRGGEKWKGWIWLLVLLFMSTLSHKVWQAHNGYFCSWQAWLLICVTLLPGSLRLQLHELLIMQ